MKGKIMKWISLKLLTSIHQKPPLRVNRHATEQKISAVHTADKELIFRIHENFYKSIRSRQSTRNKWQKT